MNTAELKPIDARVMKPGDPVVNTQGKPGRFIAYVPEARASFQAVILRSDGVVSGYTHDGRHISESEPVWFLPPDPDPIDPSPGNVDKLRKSQIPDGFRIPSHNEMPDKRASCWDARLISWEPRRQKPGTMYLPSTTYLVPIAPIRMVPLEMNDFVGKPWPIIKIGHWCCAVIALGPDDACVARFGTVNYGTMFRDGYEISHDHGVTWVKAEKKEQA